MMFNIINQTQFYPLSHICIMFGYRKFPIFWGLYHNHVTPFGIHTSFTALHQPSISPQSALNQPSIRPQSAFNQPSISPQSALNQPSISPQSALNQPSISPQSALNQPSISPQSALNQPSISPQSAFNQPSINPQSTLNQPSINPQSTLNQPSISPQSALNQPSISPQSALNQPSITPQQPSHNTMFCISGRFVIREWLKRAAETRVGINKEVKKRPEILEVINKYKADIGTYRIHKGTYITYITERVKGHKWVKGNTGL